MTLKRHLRWLLLTILLLMAAVFLLVACGGDEADTQTVERPVRVFRDDERDCVVLANNSLTPCDNNDIQVFYGYYAATGTEAMAAMTDVVLDDADVPDHDFSGVTLFNSDVPTYTVGIGLATYEDYTRSAVCIFFDMDNSPRTGYRDAAVTGIENLICEGELSYQIFWYDPGGSPILNSENPNYVHIVTTENGLALLLEATDAVILNGDISAYVAVINEDGTLQDVAGPLELTFPGGE